MTLAGPNFVHESQSDTGSSTEELSQSEIEENGVVVELSEAGAKARAEQESEQTVDIPLAAAEESPLFSEEDVEEMRHAEMAENPQKAKQHEQSYSEMWDEIEQKVNEIYRKQVDEYRRKQAENIETRDWMKEPHESKQVQEMTGEEFMQAMQKAMNEDAQTTDEELQAEVEEMQAHTVDPNPEPEIDTLDSEVEEMAIQSFRKRAEKTGKEAWADIAEDLKKTDENTQYESIAPNTRKVTTTDEELKKELRNPSGFDGTVEIEEDTGETVRAIVSQ